MDRHSKNGLEQHRDYSQQHRQHENYLRKAHTITEPNGTVGTEYKKYAPVRVSSHQQHFN